MLIRVLRIIFLVVFDSPFLSMPSFNTAFMLKSAHLKAITMLASWIWYNRARVCLIKGHKLFQLIFKLVFLETAFLAYAAVIDRRQMMQSLSNFHAWSICSSQYSCLIWSNFDKPKRIVYFQNMHKCTLKILRQLIQS